MQMKVHGRVWTELIWLRPGTVGGHLSERYSEFLN